MKTFLKNFLIFCIGFTVYQTCEGIWKTFISPGAAESFMMGLVGGTVTICIGLLNEKTFKWEWPIWIQVLIGTFYALILELLTGLLLNKWLCPMLGKPLVWDYSDLPLNFYGLLCPQFIPAWILLVIACITVDDYIRYKVYGEEKPHYTWWWKKK